MALDRIKGITIEINGDTTKLTDSLKGVTRELNTTQASLRDVNKLLKLDPTNVTLLKQKQEDLTNSIKSTEERIKAEKQALEQMKNADGFDATSKQAKDLETQIAADEAQLKSFKKQMQEFGSVGTQQLAAVGEKLEDVGKKMSSAGDKMTKYVSAPIVGAGAAAIKVTADFDTTMSKVKAVSGATGEEFETLRTKARDMAETTVFSASETADALYYMAMAGWKPQQMLDGLAGVMNLAAASGEDLATVSDIVTDDLTAFGMTAEESGHFADVLAATVTSANTDVARLGETFKYAAPVAGAMGYTLEDVALASGLMANASIKGSMAGTTLRNIFTRMAKPTKEVQAAMDRLGISLSDDEGRMYSFREIIDQLRDQFGHINMPIEEFTAQVEMLDSQLEDGTLTENQYNDALEELTQQAYGAEGAEKARAAAQLAGLRGMSGLLAIVNASVEDYDKLAGSIYNCEGAAQDMSDIMVDNLGGQLKLLKSQLEELAISFGDTMMPTIREFVTILQDIVDDFNDMDEEQRKAIIQIGLTVAAIGPLLSIGGRLVAGIGSVLKIAPALVSAFKAIGVAISGATLPALGAVVAAIAPIGMAIAAAIAIIGSFIAIGVTLYENWDNVKAKVTRAWEDMEIAISQKIEKLVEGVTQLREKVAQRWSEMKQKISETWDNIKQKTSETWSNVKSSLTETWDNLKQKGSETWGNIKDTVSTKWGDIKQTLSTTFSSILSIAEEKLDTLKNKFTTIFDNVKQTVQYAIDYIRGILNFEWHLPHLALPHFYIGGQFSLNPPSVPYIGVDWYRKAMQDGVLFTSPTVLATPSGMKGFGDAGAEIVLGLDRLRQLVGRGQTTINVYGAAGQSEEALAEIIMQKLTLMEQRTAAGAL